MFEALTISVGLFCLYSSFLDSTTFSRVCWSQSSTVSETTSREDMNIQHISYRNNSTVMELIVKCSSQYHDRACHCKGQFSPLYAEHLNHVRICTWNLWHTAPPCRTHTKSTWDQHLVTTPWVISSQVELLHHQLSVKETWRRDITNGHFGLIHSDLKQIVQLLLFSLVFFLLLLEDMNDNTISSIVDHWVELCKLENVNVFPLKWRRLLKVQRNSEI